MKVSFWLLAIGFWLVNFGLVIYSYSQIDLNLTLSSFPVYQQWQRQLIWLGYFNRPLSSLFFLIIILLFFAFYFLLLILSAKTKINFKEVWYLLLGTFFILLFAYPAFSHDIFNYIFDTRILIHYHVNPWTHTALDFPGDLWTRFMHWTHRTYPYGPFWLAVTTIPYILGFSKFVLTLFNFKLLLALSYFGSCYLITKISKKLNSLVFFAFNPLILIETLVSPHLDIFMTFLGLGAIYLYMLRKKISAIVFLLLSFLTKYVTFGYLPLVLEKVKLQKRLIFIFWLTLGVILAQIYSREILPWYFVPLIAVAALMENYFIKIIMAGFSLGGTLYYLPFLYIGEQNSLVKIWRLYFFLIPVFIALLFWFSQKKNNLKKTNE